MSYAAALAKGIELEKARVSDVKEKEIKNVEKSQATKVTTVKRHIVIKRKVAELDSDSYTESDQEACLNCNVLTSVGCDCDEESYSD